MDKEMITSPWKNMNPPICFYGSNEDVNFLLLSSLLDNIKNLNVCHHNSTVIFPLYYDSLKMNIIQQRKI